LGYHKEELDVHVRWHIWFCWGNLKERAHLEDLGVDVGIILKYILNKYNGTVWTICLPQNNIGG